MFDEEFRLLVQPLFRDDVADAVLRQLGVQRFLVHVGAVLGRKDNGVHRDRLVILEAQRDLGFAVRAQVAELLLSAQLG